MAVDNERKRWSMINMGTMIGPRILWATGSGGNLIAQKRRHNLYLYRGIALDAPGGVVVTQIRPLNTGAHGLLGGQFIVGPRGL